MHLYVYIPLSFKLGHVIGSIELYILTIAVILSDLHFGSRSQGTKKKPNSVSIDTSVLPVSHCSQSRVFGILNRKACGTCKDGKTV